MAKKSPTKVDFSEIVMAESPLATRLSPPLDSVVKVFCVHTMPNYSLPWQLNRQYSSISSGFIIRGRRLLTNAHSVEHHTQVKVKKRGLDTKFVASVLAIGRECDLALLSVDNDEFWEGVVPVEFGELPSLQDAVTVVGYPIGGDTISVTSGVVSRIEVLSYLHEGSELLGIQIDAAINSGNSGGPALNNKAQCVGIAFLAYKHEDIENIGYLIPTPVITHFINDYERNGDYTGFPTSGIEWQKLENADLRNALGMAPHLKGVYVTRVEPTSPAAEFLRPLDVLLSFDGVDIANDGTVAFRYGERIDFNYLVSEKYIGDEAIVRILRESVVKTFNIKLAAHKHLIPRHTNGRAPSYYIIGGIVFTCVSVLYLRSEFGNNFFDGAPVALMNKYCHSMVQTEDEQLVVLSQVLAAGVNIGYENFSNFQVAFYRCKRLGGHLTASTNFLDANADSFFQWHLDKESETVSAHGGELRRTIFEVWP
eukprot:c18445_g1_i1 orf=494-1936(+)